jgi:glucosyl-3-phosphoglycerate synthase
MAFIDQWRKAQQRLEVMAARPWHKWRKWQQWLRAGWQRLQLWRQGAGGAAGAATLPAPGAASGGAPGMAARNGPAPSLLRCACVVIPALNEAARIASVVRYAWSDPATAEVIVVDDSSIDDTATLARAAGAKVITSSMLGKGASMHDGLLRATQDLVVYLDGDLAQLQPQIVTNLCRPLVFDEADFVKACFGRENGGGGRVTELTARPMLKVFFPELAHLVQPLGGLIAARRSLLQTLSFESGYGVDIGLVIDAHRAGARLAEVDIGSLQHDSQPLLDLTTMAHDIAHVIHSRAREAGRLHVDQIARVYEAQRQAAADIEHVLSRRRGRQRVLLLDMDGTVTPGRFVHSLAQATGQQEALHTLLASDEPLSERNAHIAQLFKFVHRQQFERVAHSMSIRPGVVAWVNAMRRAGFMVGLVSDSSFVAADIVRRRIFADFALAHLLQFDADVCTGHWRPNTAFMPTGFWRDDVPKPLPDKVHVLQRFRQDAALPRVAEMWAVGDAANDLAMLRAADRAFVIDAKAPELLQLPGVLSFKHFDELMAHVPGVMPQQPAAAHAALTNVSTCMQA